MYPIEEQHHQLVANQPLRCKLSQPHLCTLGYLANISSSHFSPGVSPSQETLLLYFDGALWQLHLSGAM
jgi:hypothetical protein